MVSDVVGEVEKSDDGVLIIKRIRVTYLLEVPVEKRAELEELVERVHGFHAKFCPIYRSLENSIEIETAWRWAESSAD